MRRFSNKSKENLYNVHPVLQQICKNALQSSKHDFTVVDGVRTHERQVLLYNSGASKTMNSKHLVDEKTGKGHAVDIYPFLATPSKPKGTILTDAPTFIYKEIADAMYTEAGKLGYRLRWGGDWDSDGDSTDQTFMDYVHFELVL